MKVGIVGLGLIGGSLGRAMTASGHTVYGFDKNAATMEKAYLVKAIDKELTCDNVGEVDILIIAVYPRNFYEVAERYIPYMKKGAVLSDICGNKRIVLAAMEKLSLSYPDIFYLGMHPMAGKEYSGIDKSTPRLFDGASIIFVPLHAEVAILSKLKDFYLSLGFGRVIFTDAENHDSMIAYTSQLCHIVSNAFIKSESALSHVGYSAGSYKDLTRVARLEPSMWAELIIDNRDKVSKELQNLIRNLGEYQKAIEEGDEQKLRGLLSDGNELKKKIDKR